MKGFDEEKYLRGIMEKILEGDPQYRTVFLYGNADRLSDCCTELTMAWQEKHPDQKILWKNGDTFPKEWIMAIKEDKTEAFKKESRSGAFLVFDHAEGIAGMKSTMEFFYEWFDYYFIRGKQIVICSMVKPCMMEGLDDRIKTQFEGGIMARVE